MRTVKLLIFPLDLDTADAFIRVSRALGIETVGASSVMSDRGGKAVDGFVKLPFVTDPAFDAALHKTLREYSITAVYAPHQGVWRHLDTLLKTNPDFGFSLCKPDPFTETRQIFGPHDDWAASTAQPRALAVFAGCQTPRPALASSSYAALHRQFLNTPGQCDETKLQALCDITRVLPAGDVVEVGCLYGRSAFALGFLANRHKLGSLVCIDPWNIGDLTDQGPQAAVLNAEGAGIDFDKIFRIFLSTAALLDNVGYIRTTSESAMPVYEAARRAGELHSAELGRITLTEHLSLVHIDGNHRYDHVYKDVEIWSPYLAPGGWLLLDDYEWAFGDGPRRVGDELRNSPLYDSAFVSGGTLFLRRTDDKSQSVRRPRT